MALRKAVTAVVFLALAGPAIVAQDAPQPAQGNTAAQQAAPASEDGGVPRYIRPETPEQRKARLGTPEDPGPNPDPEAVWWRFGKAFHIHKFDKKWAVYDAPEGWVRPFKSVNFAKELYQENDKWVWVWNEVRDKNPAPVVDDNYRESNDEEIKYFETMRGEFTELTPPAANVRVRFEESSENLPTGGSWRNSLAVADMNGDGFQDLVLPPQRGAENAPTVFIGDGKGGWKFWPLEWPSAMNYGSVAVADFNKDKKMDMVFGIHLTGVKAFLGDGTGKFADSSAGLPDDFPTRRVITTDLNSDGWPDIVAISEGPIVRGEGATRSAGGRLRGYINRNKGAAWEQVDIADSSKYVGADWISAGNFNADKTPDFWGSSIYFNGVDTLYVSDGKGWKASADRAVVPYLGYYFASTAGKFSKSKFDDVIVSYVRVWPDDLNPKLVPVPPLKMVVGLDRITFAGKEPKRSPVVRWGSSRGVWGMGRGDFDGDGNQDVLYTVFDPREAVLLLGDGNGGFKRAELEGIKLPGTINYDLTVADLNQDKRPDVVIMYESDEVTAFGPKNGRVQVFLNRGVVKGEQP